MNLRKGTCEVGLGTGNYQPHDWRLVDEKPGGAEIESLPPLGNYTTHKTIERRWYCTRCREFETLVTRA